VKHYKSQPAVERLAQRNISLLAGSPDFVVVGKNFLHLFRSETVPLNMLDVVIVPIKGGNDQIFIVADCIYESLQNAEQVRSTGAHVGIPDCASCKPEHQICG
jgi:hypothetical protein